MDNRVKERLTGALILVAAGVILVPEIFSGRPRTDVGGDAPPAAPASEGPPLRSYTADLATSEPTPEAAVEPSPSPTTSTTSPPVAVAPPPPREAVVPSSETPKPTPALPPSRPASPPGPAATVPTPARGGWYVQVGGFSQSANAERLATQLRGQGYVVNVVQPSGGNKLTRVRVGPAPDRNAAVELQQRLRSSGHAGSLVAP